MAPLPPPANMRFPVITNVVIITKIPEGVSEEQLAAASGRSGDVIKVSYRPHDMDGPGWAMVIFTSPDLAKAARDRLHGKPIPGAPSLVAVEASLGEGLFGNLKGVNEQESVWKEARTPQGQVYYFHTVSRHSTWVKPPPEFGPSIPLPAAKLDPMPAAQAVQAAQAAIQAAPGVVEAARGKDRDGKDGREKDGNISTTVGPIGANLFIYHIPNSWDDEILRQHFEHFGKILSCRVQTDNDGRPRGFGFVSFAEAEFGTAAIQGMHGFPVEGKHLKVQLKKGDEQQLGPAAPKPPAPPPAAPTLDLAPQPPAFQPPPPPAPAAAPGGFMPVRPPLPV
eukprot:CAMPEP_0206475880 /NCGR_PEP_ID=MMETSP0324_2-20121206/34362_1 /ASSEMBLY_ACC=CAM_ASM_000836 /TAXON_ID=2866 /ORGANISM="Crypthecodinium cohnii, Strain Seligo" /LENGTH=336 /DNA_ID=CAMNT_0053951361 /DNA_START=12 /DNA_END=1019 /DNA_ORIENTATION=-